MERTAYIFDFDGTLADSMPYWGEKMLRILRECGIAYPDDIIKTIAPLGDRGTAEYFRDVMGVPLTLEEMQERMDAFASEKYRSEVCLKEGVLETLQALKAKGYSLNVLTASPHHMVDPCLRRIGIYDMFDHVWTCEDFGIMKSDPEIYLRASKLLGKQPREVAFFDDNLYAISTAVKAGMYTVAVYDLSGEDFTDELKRLADRYIRSFTEF